MDTCKHEAFDGPRCTGCGGTLYFTDDGAKVRPPPDGFVRIREEADQVRVAKSGSGTYIGGLTHSGARLVGAAMAFCWWSQRVAGWHE
jgi:hypothetical protein